MSFNTSRIQSVFRLLDMIPVAGHHVDIMAAARQELRVLDREVQEVQKKLRSISIYDKGVGENPGEPGVPGEPGEFHKSVKEEEDG